MRENRFFRKTVHQAGSPFALHAIDAAEWLLYFSKYSQMWYNLGFLSKEHIVVLRPRRCIGAIEFEGFWQLDYGGKGYSNDMVMELDLTEDQVKFLKENGIFS